MKKWRKTIDGQNEILEREGFYLSYNPRPTIGYEGEETCIASPENKTMFGTRYLILLGDFRKELEKCETLKEAEEVFRKNIDKKGSWSNELLVDNPLQTPPNEA